MSWSEILASKDLLGSAVIAAIVAGFVSIVTAALTSVVTLQTSERKIQIENITQERAKWRVKIRLLSKQVGQACAGREVDKLVDLRHQFELILNPFDPEDRAILDEIRTLERLENTNRDAQQFFNRVSMLLKDDWEFAKYEAEGPSRHFRKPGRTPFEYFPKSAQVDENTKT